MLKHFLETDGDDPNHYLNGIYDFKGNKYKKYFEGEQSNNNNINNNIKQNHLRRLKIADETYRNGKSFIDSFNGQFPVIYLNLKTVKETINQTFDQSQRTVVREAYQKHSYLYRKHLIDRLMVEKTKKLKREQLERMDIDILENLLNKYSDHMKQFKSYQNGGSDYPLDYSIYFLSKLLYNHYKQKVFILVDEFDKPVNNILSDTKNFSKEIINQAKEYSESIFDLITPCSKGEVFTKQIIMVGILNSEIQEVSSSLNNAHKEGIMTGKLVGYFGFDEQEVKYLIDNTFDFKNNEEKDLLFFNLKYWYNGLVIGEDTQVFSPSSMMAFLYDLNEFKHNPYYQKPHFQTYWKDTQTLNALQNFSDILITKETQNEIFEKLVKISLLQSVIFNCNQTTPLHSILSSLETSDDKFEDLIFHYLLRSGYITKVTNSNNEYKIPSKEVELDYIEVIECLKSTFFINDGEKVKFKKVVEKINFYSYDKLQVDEAMTSALSHAVIKYPHISEECFRLIINDSIENSMIKSVYKDVEVKSGSGRSDLIYYYKDCANLYELIMNDNKQEDKLEEAEKQIYNNNYMKRITELADTEKFKNIKIIKLIPVQMYRKGNNLTWIYQTGNIHEYSIEEAKYIVNKIDQLDCQIKQESSNKLKNEFIDQKIQYIKELISTNQPFQIIKENIDNQQVDESDSMNVQTQELAQELVNQGIQYDTLKIAKKIKSQNYFREDVTEQDLQEAKIGLGEKYAPKAVSAIQTLFNYQKNKFRGKKRSKDLKKVFQKNRNKNSVNDKVE